MSKHNKAYDAGFVEGQVILAERHDKEMKSFQEIFARHRTDDEDRAFRAGQKRGHMEGAAAQLSMHQRQETDKAEIIRRKEFVYTLAHYASPAGWTARKQIARGLYLEIYGEEWPDA